VIKKAGSGKEPLLAVNVTFDRPSEWVDVAAHRPLIY